MYKIVPLILVLVACSGSNESAVGSIDDTFRPECDVACRLAASDRSCEVPSNCENDCAALTSGLETQCGKCVAAKTWLWGNEDGTCTTTTPLEGNCSDACVPGSHDSRPDFRAECDVACRLAADDRNCEAPSNCVDDCAALASGLETQCGKCVAEKTWLWGNEDGTCTTTTPLEGNCSDACVPGSHDSRPDFRAECDVACRLAAGDRNCDAPSNCVDDCATLTSGLETQCGKCVAEKTWLVSNEDGTCSTTTPIEGDCSAACDG